MGKIRINPSGTDGLFTWFPESIHLIGFTNWTEDDEVNFDAKRTLDAEIVTRIRDAIEDCRVQLHGITRRQILDWIGSARDLAVQFDWLGFRYEMQTTYDISAPFKLIVRSIEKIALLDDPDEFGDQYGNHFPIVVRDLRKERALRANPLAGTW
jgi:hypothetical protein